MRNTPEDNLAYPVLIVLESGSSGSGFQLNTDENMYFITAKHVLFDNKGNLLADKAEITCQSKDINDDTTTVFSVNLKDLNNSKNVYSHQSKDVAAFRIGKVETNKNGNNYTCTPIPGVDVKQTGKTGPISVAKETPIMIDQVLVANDIYLYGYPLSLGLKNSPQFDYNKPLLRKGIVASINKKEGTIILDCPVYYGNSGGPVVQVTREQGNSRHSVIGVVSQFIPYAEDWINQSNRIVHTEISNSGYSVAVSMDYVYEMLGISSPPSTS